MGIKSLFTVINMAMGARKVITEPKRNATPKCANAILRYMGLRVNRKGPSVIRVVDSLKGFIAVSFFANNRADHDTINTPMTIKSMPL